MRKPTIFFFALGLLWLFLKGLSAFLSSSHGIGGAIVLIACLLPAFFVFCIAQQQRWMGVLLGGITWYFLLPIVPIHSIELGMLATLGICGLLLIHMAVARQSWFGAFTTWQSRIMLCVLAWLAVRVAMERPGSVYLGSMGGAKEAYIFLLGGIAFFLPKFLLDICKDTRRSLRVAINLALLAFCIHCGIRFYEDPGWGVRSLFMRPAWFLCSFAIAWTAYLSWHGRSRYSRNGMRVWLASGVTFLLAALSPHRSRILFAAGMLCAVSYLYGRLSRSVGTLFLILCATAVLLSVSGMQLPTPVSRSLSILFPHQTKNAEEYIREYRLSGELGWESPFRAHLMRMAEENIRKHPFIGKGFTFSTREYWLSHGLSGTMESQYRLLAATGAYHNSLVQLAVACGLPVTLLFCIAAVGILVPFLKWLREVDEKYTRIFMMGILAFFSAVTGQVLMNGGSQDFYFMCMLLGFMHYGQQSLPHGKPKPEVQAGTEVMERELQT